VVRQGDREVVGEKSWLGVGLEGRSFIDPCRFEGEGRVMAWRQG
jgi:hypothetical protein